MIDIIYSLVLAVFCFGGGLVLGFIVGYSKDELDKYDDMIDLEERREKLNNEVDQIIKTG